MYLLCAVPKFLRVLKTNIFKPSVAVYAYNPSTMEAETRGSKQAERCPGSTYWEPGYCELHSKLETISEINKCN